MPVSGEGSGTTARTVRVAWSARAIATASESARSAWGEPSKPTRMERNMVASLVVTINLAR